MTLLPHNEKLLLRQVARHDEKAFKALFEAYRSRLYHYIIGIVKSRETAEEMVIDVFLKIWQQRTKLPELQSFRAFLFIVARNHTLNTLETAGRSQAAIGAITRQALASRSTSSPPGASRPGGPAPQRRPRRRCRRTRSRPVTEKG